MFTLLVRVVIIKILNVSTEFGVAAVELNNSEIRKLEKLQKPRLHTVNVTQRGEKSLRDIYGAR